MTPGTGLYLSQDQHRPELMFRIFASSFGSKPSLIKETDRSKDRGQKERWPLGSGADHP